MSSLKQLIYNALFKIATPGSHELVYDTPEESRDAFIALVMAELFPSEVAAPVAVVKAESPKKVKAASPKKAKAKAESPKKTKKAKAESPKKAAVVVEVAKVESPKKSTKKAAAVVVAPVVVAAKTESPKKVKQTKEEKEAEKAKAKAAKEEEAAKVKAAKEEEKAKAKAEKVKASPKKAAKAKEEVKKAEVNLAKIDPTWRKLLKESDKDTAKEREPLLLAYMNAMSNSAFNGKSAKEHVADFAASLAAPAAPVAVEMVDASLEVVEFQGKEYYVNTETKRVYEGELAADGSLNVTRPVGYVGMADFKDMSLE